ncbi:YopX family protein [Ferviditalea candida]|uniref:YopX family protein n=1 Tax=Ferviditalea candida TaxID=3108399 RepID=A0ABU5ZKM6_9BACL|nr:YopX family protein [Paenibacillaceae bacterium T2]
MRDIKFRAWDTETKEMSYDFLGKNWLKVCIESPFVELMQYTGLKDKNGKEIYEGDITVSEHASYSILWDENMAQFKAKIEKTDSVLTKGCSFPLWQYIENNEKCRIEVIGNIYEHKELIKCEH